MLDKAYDLVLRLPKFRGKAKLASLCGSMLRPKASRIIHDMRMELDPDEWLQVDLRTFGRLEPETTALFERILKQGDTYVDVGAHVGYHVLVARHCVGPGGRLYAIDPQPYNCHKLLTNARLNGFHNVVVFAAAAGIAAGFVSLKDQAVSDRSRLTLAGPGVNDRNVTFVVPVIRLDWLFAAHAIDHVDLLKIDTEGFEANVLEGAGQALNRIGNVVLEILPDEPAHKVGQIEQVLRSAGFVMSDVAGAKWQPGRPCVENNVWARRP